LSERFLEDVIDFATDPVKLRLEIGREQTRWVWVVDWLGAFSRLASAFWNLSLRRHGLRKDQRSQNHRQDPRHSDEYASAHDPLLSFLPWWRIPGETVSTSVFRNNTRPLGVRWWYLHHMTFYFAPRGFRYELTLPPKGNRYATPTAPDRQ